MILKLLGWLGLSKFKAFLYGAAFISVAATLTGAYVKGRMDCNASVREATYKARIAQLEREAKIIRKQLDDALEFQSDLDEAEKANDKIGPPLDDPSPTVCGLDSDWLRKLSKLR